MRAVAAGWLSSWSLLVVLGGVACAVSGCSAGKGAPAVVDVDGARPDLPRPRMVSDAGGAEVAGPPGCGEPGRACCAGNLCGSGGCCVESRCVEQGAACLLVEGVCQRGSCGGGACGAVDQPCCARGSCTAPGSVCAGGTCVGCGGYGEECCPGQGCLAGGTGCLGGRCLPCGGAGQSCCSSGMCAGGGCCADNVCVAVGGSCGAQGRCEGGLCDGCGKKDRACCLGAPRRPCEGAELGCDFASRVCVSDCGGEGQPCCLDVPCGAGLSCAFIPPAAPGALALRVCQRCGGPGQPCCQQPGAVVCADGGCCAGGLCSASGSECLTPQGPAGACMLGRCLGCGLNGQACCQQGARRCADDSAICAAVGSTPDPSTGGATPPPPRICQVCGEPGQPCCPLNRCAGGCCVRTGILDGGTCVAEGTACRPGGALCGGGTCGACGGPGQPCCAGACTVAQTTCRLIAGHGERCLPCGNRGESCCTDAPPFGLVPPLPPCSVPFTCRGGFCADP